MAENIAVAPIGLLDMFNSGGAVDQFQVHLASKSQLDNDESTSLTKNRPVTARVTLKVRGCGRFGAYSSQSPLKCTVDGIDTDFIYDSASGLATFMIPVPQEEMYQWSIEIVV